MLPYHVVVQPRPLHTKGGVYVSRPQFSPILTDGVFLREKHKKNGPVRIFVPGPYTGTRFYNRDIRKSSPIPQKPLISAHRQQVQLLHSYPCGVLGQLLRPSGARFPRLDGRIYFVRLVLRLFSDLLLARTPGLRNTLSRGAGP